MGGRLLFRDSQGRDGAVDLTPTETVFVGRGLECAIRTDDAMVSRRHSQVRMEGGRFLVEDLGSANGTLVNNSRIQKQILNHNDVVQCGSMWIRYIEDGPLFPQHQVRPPVAGPGGDPPPKKGGTMRIDANDVPGLPQAQGQPPRPNPMGYAGTLAQPPGSSPQPAPSPYGQPPGAPGGGYGAAPVMPQPGYGQPPGMPGMGAGGPPAMPSMGGGGPPGIPGAFGGGGFGGSAAGAARPGAPAMPSQVGGPPAMPGMGGPPAMPGMGGPPAMPGMGGPPAMPGGPPPMPGAGGIFGGGAPAIGGPPGMPGAAGKEPSIVVDMDGLQDGANREQMTKLALELKRQQKAFDDLQANHDREVADGKRIRAEAATLRDRIEEMRATIKDREDQAGAHGRVADELRDELQQTRNELTGVRGEMTQMAESMATRERQLGRSQDDITKLKDDLEDMSRQLAEVSRTKDEGWKKLNEQLSEIEHLREVINEQERMLEERRVGLISQEEVIKELRAEKERSLKNLHQVKAERDEVKMGASRRDAQVGALEEENKRLSRMLVESQTGGAGGASGDAVMRLTNELKDLKVEYRKVEADRDRLQESHDKNTRDLDKLEGRVAQLEVELQESTHGKMAAESARSVAEEALARSEVARHKAAEEAIASARARDQASTGGDAQVREIEKLKKKLADAEKATAGATAADVSALQAEIETLKLKVKEADGKAQVAERATKGLEAQLDAARVEAQTAKGAAERAQAAAANAGAAAAAAASEGGGGGGGGGAPNGEIASRAREVYDAINDILSELRNNLNLVKDELPNLGGGNPDSVRIIQETVETLVGSAEDAKGSLRGLRDLAEGS
ncbi:MAG TPA: FHA domain-containing protein [Kofleriaceae bacterium]|nr:FHA domain-containing protein [Kofleriaceae bacterium]